MIPDFLQNRTRIVPEIAPASRQNRSRLAPELLQNPARFPTAIAPASRQNSSRLAPESRQNLSQLGSERNSNSLDNINICLKKYEILIKKVLFFGK